MFYVVRVLHFFHVYINGGHEPKCYFPERLIFSAFIDSYCVAEHGGRCTTNKLAATHCVRKSSETEDLAISQHRGPEQ